MAALKCFGEIVQEYSIDRFQQISELLFPIISPVSLLCLFHYFCGGNTGNTGFSLKHGQESWKPGRGKEKGLEPRNDVPTKCKAIR